jgi:hypothetical protein
MIRRWLVALTLALCPTPLWAETASADTLPPPPPPSRPKAAQSAAPLVLESARIPVKPAEPDLLRFIIHGEYQLRAEFLSPLRLLQSDATFDQLGQEERVYHWLRITPRFQIGDHFELVAQADVPRGMFSSEEPQGVVTHDELYAEANPFQFDPRWLFLDYLSAPLAVRVGQQPFHHGMGLVENDGNHPPFFGDYQGGDRFERAQLLLRPGGKLVLIAAADLVFEDETAELTEGDVALRGTLGARYGERAGNVSVLGIVRHQRYDGSGSEEREFNTVLIDSAGGFEVPIRASGAILFGEYEVAFRFGDESLGRTLTGPVVNDDDLTVTGFGGAARLGAVWPSSSARDAFGRLVFAMEVGHASGDDAPQDGHEQAFAFDPNHEVGLLLFDQVLRWKSARSKAIVGDSPRVSDLATRGSVSNATYLYPTFLWRPRRELDLKAGMVIAQSAEDLIDPASVLITGAATNYDGGAPARDLGLELDVGAEWRLALNTDLNLELGAQAGLLLPGTAFDSASGNALDAQYLAMLRMGVQY